MVTDGRKRITKIEEFEAGDILIFGVTAHVNIYAGDGKFWDAGDDRAREDIRKGAFKGYAKKLNPFTDFRSHPYSYAYRYIGN